MVRVADKQPIFRAAFQKQFSGKIAAETVVAADGAVGIGRLDGPPDDERCVGAGKVAQHCPARSLAEEDEAVRRAGAEQVDAALCVDDSGRREQQVLVPDRQRLRYAGEQLEDERIGDGAVPMRAEIQHDSDRIGAHLAQLLRVAIDSVTMRAGDFQDALPRLLRHQRTAVQNPRDGRLRHVGEACDIAHVHGHGPGAATAAPGRVCRLVLRLGHAPLILRMA